MNALYHVMNVFLARSRRVADNKFQDFQDRGKFNPIFFPIKNIKVILFFLTMKI